MSDGRYNDTALKDMLDAMEEALKRGEDGYFGIAPPAASKHSSKSTGGLSDEQIKSAGGDPPADFPEVIDVLRSIMERASSEEGSNEFASLSFREISALSLELIIDIGPAALMLMSPGSRNNLGNNVTLIYMMGQLHGRKLEREAKK